MISTRIYMAIGLFISIAGAGCQSKEQQRIAHHADTVEDVTGGHTRVVWAQDTQHLNDVFVRGDQLRLMAFDSRDGKGERVLLPGPGNFTKPMIAPDGDVIVFTDNRGPSVHTVDWTGKQTRKVVDGTALALWRDPQTGVDWIYVATQPTGSGAPAYRQMHRIALRAPHQREAVWLPSPVGEDNFQLSADGRIAGGNFPWPECGILHVDDNRFERLGRGCWTSLAPDNSYLFWIFDGSHRNLLLFNTRTGARWTINISAAPALGGHEAYHPRWSNHPRIMAVTGPYTIRSGGNNIRGGGPEVEVHIGRFSDDFQRLEKWVQVTSNDWANFAPDVWVKTAPNTDATRPVEAPETAHREVSTSTTGAATVKVRLAHASQVPSPEDILPYTSGLVAHEYEILEIIEGEIDQPHILIAHWVIRDSQVLETAHRRQDEVFTLRVERYDDRSDLEGERLSMDTDNILLELYYDTNS